MAFCHPLLPATHQIQETMTRDGRGTSYTNNVWGFRCRALNLEQALHESSCGPAVDPSVGASPMAAGVRTVRPKIYPPAGTHRMDSTT